MPFESTGAGNLVLNGDGFFISYRPSLSGSNPTLDLCATLATAISGELHGNDLAETALVGDRQDLGANPYFILNGDYRKQYENIVDKGWGACYQFWLSEVAKGNKSQLSRDPLEMDLAVGRAN